MNDLTNEIENREVDVDNLEEQAIRSVIEQYIRDGNGQVTLKDLVEQVYVRSGFRGNLIIELIELQRYRERNGNSNNNISDIEKEIYNILDSLYKKENYSHLLRKIANLYKEMIDGKIHPYKYPLTGYEVINFDIENTGPIIKVDNILIKNTENIKEMEEQAIRSVIEQYIEDGNDQVTLKDLFDQVYIYSGFRDSLIIELQKYRERNGNSNNNISDIEKEIYKILEPLYKVYKEEDTEEDKKNNYMKNYKYLLEKIADLYSVKMINGETYNENSPLTDDEVITFDEEDSSLVIKIGGEMKKSNVATPSYAKIIIDHMNQIREKNEADFYALANDRQMYTDSVRFDITYKGIASLFHDESIFDTNESIFNTRVNEYTLEDIAIFRALLKYRNKCVTLKELYYEVYVETLNILFNQYKDTNPNLASTIENRIVEEQSKMENEDSLSNFMRKINGCYSQNYVAEINMDGFEEKDKTTLEQFVSALIQITPTTPDKNNPLLFITSLRPSPTIEFKLDGNYLTISDLHLDKGYKKVRTIERSNGGQIEDRTWQVFKSNISKFIILLLKEIKERNGKGKKINGIIFLGDIFDCENIYKEKGGSVEKFVSDISKILKSSKSPKKRPNALKELKDILKDIDIYYIPGNHDNRLGRKQFIELMNSLGTNILGKNMINLENSSVVMYSNSEHSNSERFLVCHPTATDWGKQKTEKLTKDIEAEKTFHLNEYVAICQSLFDCPNSNSELNELKKELKAEIGQDDKPKLREFLHRVNEIINDSNTALAEFYKPYITALPSNETFFDKQVNLFKLKDGKYKFTARQNLVLNYKEFVVRASAHNKENANNQIEIRVSFDSKYSADYIITGHYHSEENHGTINASNGTKIYYTQAIKYDSTLNSAPIESLPEDIEATHVNSMRH